MENNKRHPTGALPIDIELMFIVRQRQLEVSTARGKLVTLTEIGNEIVKVGLMNVPDEQKKDVNKSEESNGVK